MDSFANKGLAMAMYSLNLQTDACSENEEELEGQDLSMLRSSCGRYIYHLAIIDFLQTYNWQKKAERLIKSSELLLTSRDPQMTKHLSCI